MDTNAILGPVATLALWSMIMWVWMYATRIPAMQRAKIDAAKMVGGTGKGLDDVLPADVQWKAHNYNHLMEQPTVFYAVAIALAAGGMGGGLNAQIAWAYVGLRSEEHTSELQSLMRISYAVFCSQKKNKTYA